MNYYYKYIKYKNKYNDLTEKIRGGADSDHEETPHHIKTQLDNVTAELTKIHKGSKTMLGELQKQTNKEKRERGKPVEELYKKTIENEQKVNDAQTHKDAPNHHIEAAKGHEEIVKALTKKKRELERQHEDQHEDWDMIESTHSDITPITDAIKFHNNAIKTHLTAADIHKQPEEEKQIQKRAKAYARTLADTARNKDRKEEKKKRELAEEHIRTIADTEEEEKEKDEDEDKPLGESFDMLNSFNSSLRPTMEHGRHFPQQVKEEEEHKPLGEEHIRTIADTEEDEDEDKPLGESFNMLNSFDSRVRPTMGHGRHFPQQVKEEEEHKPLGESFDRSRGFGTYSKEFYKYFSEEMDKLAHTQGTECVDAEEAIAQHLFKALDGDKDDLDDLEYDEECHEECHDEPEYAFIGQDDTKEDKEDFDMLSSFNRHTTPGIGYSSEQYQAPPPGYKGDMSRWNGGWHDESGALHQAF